MNGPIRAEEIVAVGEARTSPGEVPDEVGLVDVSATGYQAVFLLPRGVTPGMVADKRDVLARSLYGKGRITSVRVHPSE